MRIAYLVNARLPTEKAHGYQISKMCEALARAGADVLLVHPRRWQRDPRLREASVFDYYGVEPRFRVRTTRNVDVVPLSSRLPGALSRYLFFGHAVVWGAWAVRVARRQGAELVYTRSSAVARRAVRAGLDTVYEAHAARRGAQRRILREIGGRQELRRVVAITSHIRRRLRDQGVPEEKLLLLPDAVDLSHFRDLPDRLECRRRLELPAHRAIVGYVGRFQTLEEEKGIPELVRAMGALGRSGPAPGSPDAPGPAPADAPGSAPGDAPGPAPAAVPGPEGGRPDPFLLCVGGPLDPVPGYRELARSLGLDPEGLRFQDRVPNREVPLWMRAADVVTIPWPWTEFSAWFTSPLKLFEYMASGTPIVASDLPSLRDVLRHDENAWLVEPGDPGALAMGIRTLLDDRERAERLAARAREDVEEHTWERRAARVLESLGLEPGPRERPARTGSGP